jgi:transposase-like protein
MTRDRISTHTTMLEHLPHGFQPTAPFAFQHPAVYVSDLADQHLEADDLLIQLRWPESPVCPFCGCDRHYRLNMPLQIRRRLKCASCRKQYTVLKGTALERSHIPPGKWLLLASHFAAKKHHINLSELARITGLSYKTCWAVNKRMAEHWDSDPLLKAVQHAVQQKTLIV